MQLSLRVAGLGLYSAELSITFRTLLTDEELLPLPQPIAQTEHFLK